MPKIKKSKETMIDIGLCQISDVVPLARRNKREQRAHEKLQKYTTEVNKDAWVKAVELVRGEWNPIPKHLRCFASLKITKLNKETETGLNQWLILEFKKAVLSRNWANAVKLAQTIFKNYSSFNERVHLQVFLSVLMSNPKVDETVLTNACSFLWKMEIKDAMSELMRCFCSMPKKLPSEFLSTAATGKIYVRSKRDLNDEKNLLDLKYTQHLGKSRENNMYIA